MFSETTFGFSVRGFRPINEMPCGRNSYRREISEEPIPHKESLVLKVMQTLIKDFMGLFGFKHRECHTSYKKQLIRIRRRIEDISDEKEKEQLTIALNDLSDKIIEMIIQFRVTSHALREHKYLQRKIDMILADFLTEFGTIN